MTDVPQHLGVSQRHQVFYWNAAFIGIFLLSTLKTIKLPIQYAASFYWLSYEHGFVKRGLIGSLLASLPFDTNYAVVCTISLTFYLLYFLLIWFLSQTLLREAPSVLAISALLYASSIGVVYMSGTLGYFDHLAIVLAMTVLFARRFTARLLLCLATGVVAILSHEAAFLRFIPVTYFAVFVSARSRGDLFAAVSVVVLLALHLGLVLAVTRLGTLDPEATALLKADMAARADIELSFLLFDVVSSLPAAEARSTLSIFNPVARFDSLVIVLPSLAFLLFLVARLIMSATRPFWMFLVAAAAILSPLSLSLLAKDMHRWDAMAISNAFLVLVVILRDGVVSSQVLSTGLQQKLLPISLVALAFSASSTTFLVSHQPVDQFPFIELRREVLEFLSTQGSGEDGSGTGS